MTIFFKPTDTFEVIFTTINNRGEETMRQYFPALTFARLMTLTTAFTVGREAEDVRMVVDIAFTPRS